MSEALERLALLLNEKQMLKLKNSHVLIIGIGGVGSYVCEALTRSGIGKLTLVDKDVCDVTNLNRQLQVTYQTLGQPKVNAMKDRILSISPDCKVNTIHEFVTESNLLDLLDDDIDFVVDACDTVTVKIALIEQCARLNLPLISSMGMANKLDPTKIEILKLSKTYNDPLCKVLRRELKKRRFRKDPIVVFSSELPIKIDYGDVEVDASLTRKSQFTPGSTAFVPATSGLVCASYVVRQLINGV